MGKGARLRAERRAARPELTRELKWEIDRQIKAEAKKTLLEYDRKYKADFDAAILWALHENCNFGAARLKSFWLAFNGLHEKLRKQIQERYGLPEEDSIWYCKQQLREIGLDVDEMEEKYG